MHGIRSILVKRIVAALLMAALLFIHGVKLLHAHHNSRQDTHHHHQCLTEKTYLPAGSLYCFICDFEYIKDTDLPYFSISIKPPFVLLPVTGEFLCAAPAANTHTISARGPPASA